MENLIIIKLGGSVVTNKETTDCNLRSELLTEIFSHLKDWRDNHPETQLILVHGAGGHIHNLAKQYELKTTCVGNEEKIKKALEVQDTCEVLSRALIGYGQTVDLPLVSVPTHDVVTNKDSDLDSLDLTPVKAVLTDKKIPVLYGDMVPDSERELSICSGDTVMSELTSLLKPVRIFYASDINGIYTNDPHQQPEAELIENLTVAELNSERIKLSGSHNVDVTGGLKTKLSDCKKLFFDNNQLKTIEVYNGLNPLHTKKTLNRELFPHTTITK